MAKGKYKARAANREAARDNELIVEKVDEIARLKAALAQTEGQLQKERAERGTLVLARANELSAEQTKPVREEIVSLKHQCLEDQVRYAVLMWEIMHRKKFGRPAPVHLHKEDEPESYEYWIAVNWEIASLFGDDWESIERFQFLCQGWEMKLSGCELHGNRGQPTLKQTAREATRQVRKGNIRDLMRGRVKAMRAHYDRVYAARQGGDTEPMFLFRDTLSDTQASEDRRENLVDKMRETSKA